MSADTPAEKWFPEIMYEEDSKIPFVPVPNGEVMPKILFMFESRETGEFEPGLDGEPLPIVQMDLHQYASMNSLKEALDPATFDTVRMGLGLDPLQVAAQKGKAVTENIRKAVT